MATENTKYCTVVEALKRAIETGELAPGSKLPGQNILGTQYGVSPITTKRALSELEQLGYIERRPRSGSYVRRQLRRFQEVDIILGRMIENPAMWLGDYWNGIETEASKLGIPTKITREFLPGSQERGVVIIGEEDELVRQLREAGIPHVAGILEARHANLNVRINYRRVAAALAASMREAGCRKLYYLGNLGQPTHQSAAEGFRDAIADNIRNVNDETIIPAVEQLLAADPQVDGFIVMGGALPFRVLPTLLAASRRVQLGVFTENQAIRQLRGTAFMADYELAEAGRLTFQLLCEAAADKHLPATTRYPDFQILPPDHR